MKKNKTIGYLIGDKGKIIPIKGFKIYREGKPLLINKKYEKENTKT